MAEVTKKSPFKMYSKNARSQRTETKYSVPSNSKSKTTQTPQIRANQPVHAFLTLEIPELLIQDTEATHFAKNYFHRDDWDFDSTLSQKPILAFTDLWNSNSRIPVIDFRSQLLATKEIKLYIKDLKFKNLWKRISVLVIKNCNKLRNSTINFINKSEFLSLHFFVDVVSLILDGIYSTRRSTRSFFHPKTNKYASCKHIVSKHIVQLLSSKSIPQMINMTIRMELWNSKTLHIRIKPTLFSCWNMLPAEKQSLFHLKRCFITFKTVFYNVSSTIWNESNKKSASHVGCPRSSSLSNDVQFSPWKHSIQPHKTIWAKCYRFSISNRII